MGDDHVQIPYSDGTGGEVAVFVDLENIRYSSINSFGREPDPIAWRDKALRYGLMAVARAYADFDQHPPQVRTRLDVAGIEAQHFPAKRSIDQAGREKIQSRSDLSLVIDIINTALTRPDIKTFLLFTGDKDFIRVVTILRNRLGKRVIICGVPGSVSPDLVAAAGEEDPLDIARSVDMDIAVIRAIDAYVAQLHDGFVPTQSHMSRTLWRFLDRAVLQSEHIEAKVMEFLRKGILTKRPCVNGQGQELVTTELNLDHPLVRETLPHRVEAIAALPVDDEDADGDAYYDGYDDGEETVDGGVTVSGEAGTVTTGSDDDEDDEPAEGNALTAADVEDEVEDEDEDDNWGNVITARDRVYRAGLPAPGNA
ncbi:MAG: NYN domain-containing protein [Chloroflexota bacterium]|nr:NYN domain-containing protein [Chloroflexota bacterium]MDQ3513814.1 NYN domain-containing protein [Chloroflexota bacterium]